MSRPALLLAALLVAAAASGCAQANSQTSSTTEVPTDIQQVEVSHDTGAIRGIVVTDSITPIPGANVTIKADGKDLSKRTSATGGFSFTGLKPGTYFVTASKAGYKSVQSSTTVAADDENPPVLKIILPADLANRPYAQLSLWKGFLECSFGVQAPAPVGGVGVNPCALDEANSHNTNPVGLDAGMPTLLQAEMVWTGNQQTANILSEGVYLSGTADFINAQGTSPVTMKVPGDLIVKNLGNVTTITERVFPGGDDSNPATVITNQDFTIYNTQFHGFLPKDDWTFVKDGECISPDQCGAAP
jgi:hypothetical protein